MNTDILFIKYTYLAPGNLVFKTFRDLTKCKFWLWILTEVFLQVKAKFSFNCLLHSYKNCNITTRHVWPKELESDWFHFLDWQEKWKKNGWLLLQVCATSPLCIWHFSHSSSKAGGTHGCNSFPFSAKKSRWKNVAVSAWPCTSL